MGTNDMPDLTAEQLAFLDELSRAPRSAGAQVDAAVVGPLIRANLVRWEDDPGAAAQRHLTRRSTFSLTESGAQALADRVRGLRAG